MPHLGVTLTAWGPLLNIIVSVSAPRAAALTAAGKPTPTPPVAKVLVDTGASQTAIDSAILTKLALSPTGVAPIHTPSTGGVPHSASLYDVGIVIPGHTPGTIVHSIPAIPVFDGDFQSQGIDGL
jgi:hypothetical protein